MPDSEQPDLTRLTVDLLSAYFANNSVPSSELAALIEQTRSALAGQSASGAQAEAPQKPAVSIEESLASREHILSLIDGKPYKSLKRHLANNGLTPPEYRSRYGLAADYPMVAPAYSEHRRAVAQRMGLGGRPGGAKREESPAPVKERSSAPKAAADGSTSVSTSVSTASAVKPKSPPAAKQASSPATTAEKPATVSRGSKKRFAREPQAAAETAKAPAAPKTAPPPKAGKSVSSKPKSKTPKSADATTAASKPEGASATTSAPAATAASSAGGAPKTATSKAKRNGSNATRSAKAPAPKAAPKPRNSRAKAEPAKADTKPSE